VAVRQQVRLPSGRELSAIVLGEGAPAVVFLAGFMAGASEWSAVQRQVASHALTVGYDRAGYGASSEADRSPSAEAALADLLELLDALGVSEPVVLVAHSWGGTLLRLLAREHPDRLAAVCLIDATRSELLPARATRAQGVGLRVMARLGRLRLHRLLVTKTLANKLQGLNPGERVAFLADSTDVRTLRAGIRENDAMTAGDLQLLHELERAGLPDIPVTFMVGKQVDAGAKKTRARMLVGYEQEAREHGQARFVVADRSGHMVPQQQPDLVTHEILDLIGGRTHA
jgi:pimeloyl-ACP methyl ester carboxylesterase